jgi:HupE / UreJ protein
MRAANLSVVNCFFKKISVFLAFYFIYAGRFHNPLLAHTTGVSYSEIRIYQREVDVHLRLRLSELNFAAQLDSNSDLSISNEEVRIGSSKIARRVFDNFQIEAQGEVGKASLNALKLIPSAGELECSLAYSFSQPIEDVVLKVTLHNITDTGHWNLAQLQYDDQQEQKYFNLENPTAIIELRRGWMSYVRLGERFLVFGGKRILTGYDSLAFLLGLLLVAQTFNSLVKSVGIFLIAQTLTLQVGALDVISLPPRFVDSAIALSVAYIALENLLLKEVANRWLIAGLFGLIFGFSFSVNIKEWGLPKKGLITSLLSFSLGSILAVGVSAALIFLFLHYLNRFEWQKKATTFASVILVGVGFFWFVKRTF